MTSLYVFINENLEHHINEGKILDAIKEWFKKLFEPSNREFDRYNPDSKISGMKLNDYKKYLEENFDIKELDFKEIPNKDLKNIVYPNGEEPNQDGEIGFYKFIDNANNKKDNTEYFGFIYNDKKVKDTVCLVNCIHNEKTIEILNLQIIKEFISLISIKKAINLLIETKEFIQEANQLIIKETTDKSLYKQLINDCEFEEQYDKENNVNIAIKNL